MLSFTCTCRHSLSFDDQRCGGCGAEIGFDPDRMKLGTLESRPGGVWSFRGDSQRPLPAFRFCVHRTATAACNWLLDAGDCARMCIACGTTRIIPDLSRPRNAERFRRLESAKRRALVNVLAAGLTIVPRTAEPQHGLAFDLLESFECGPRVMTGHASGVITIDVAEADDDYRERNREALREPYRTVLGHMRHELGHYYWDIIVWGGAWLEPFRALFGDERDEYGAALERHYASGAPPDWKERFVTSYAASHPWEDWAETFAHYMHLRSTLETVASYQLDTSSVRVSTAPIGSEGLYATEPEAAGTAFLAWVNAWRVLITVLNEAARSMGQPDTYPFALTAAVVKKLHFVHCAVSGERVTETPGLPHNLQVPPTLAH